jgi:hypothetical protein
VSHTPRVSVVVIFRDAERFLDEAIASVVSQTYGDWELLLVDDGSIDGSSSVALHWVEQHPDRVRYLAHRGCSNRGMSASRNLGIRHARGEFLAFLDADDVWLPDKLTAQVALLDAWPDAAMVYGPTQWWYSWTGQPADQGRDFVHPLGIPPETALQPPTLVLQLLRNESASPCTCSVLVRREIVEHVRGFEESFTGLYEDQVFCTKICLQFPVVASSACWYRYRQHPNSACAVAMRSGQARAARLRFLEWLASHMSEHRIRDPRVSRALRRELWATKYPALQRSFARCAHVTRAVRSRVPSLPIVRNLRCLQLRRMRPLGDGRQSGTPVVRAYWADYLHHHRPDIRGHGLEIGTSRTLWQYGSPELTWADALDLTIRNPEVTVVGDLSRADHIPSETYDCFVNQFTMHVMYDLEAALYHSVRILRPGGVLLVNFPCMDYYFPGGLDMGTGAPLFSFWWFTPIQIENLLRRVGLTGDDYKLTLYGNLFARVAYQMNLPAEELTARELEYVDPGHPLLICARVVKPRIWHVARPAYREPWLPEASPIRWNPVTGHYAQPGPGA